MSQCCCAFITCALMLVATSPTGSFSNLASASTVIDSGSNRCSWQIGSSNPIPRFPSLPGSGWDNLRNIAMGPVADTSFTDCVLSDDGAYVLPPTVLLHARRESDVKATAEILDHFDNYTFSGSYSINFDTGTLLQSVPISGKLSADYQQAKAIATANRLTIGRTRLRYLVYSAKLKPDFKLSDLFLRRLMEVVRAVEHDGRKQLTRYLADLVIRDFGTHVVTSVEAGGLIEKMDYFRNSSKSGDWLDDKTRLSAVMKANFRLLLGIGIDGDAAVTKQDIEVYQKSLGQTSLRSLGGSVLGPAPDLTEWLRTLKDSLVPVDCNGVPISAAINSVNLPEVKPLSLRQLQTVIEDAIMRYYGANAVKGCMEPGSGNFDPLANIAGDCQAMAMTFSFGGVYQTCQDNDPSAGLQPCSAAETKNPITGAATCPPDFMAVPLFMASGRRKIKCKPKTKKCLLLFTCNDGEECVTSNSTLTAYWCAATRDATLKAPSGMLYGGSFANDGRFVNEITQSKSCGKFFRPYQIGRDIQLCLSMDLEAASRYRIPFGGFFACNSGNPLADSKRPIKARWSATASVSMPGASTASSSGDTLAPKRCPKGFSQVTLDTVDGCAVMQCVKGSTRGSKQPIRRPPFEDPDYEILADGLPTDPSRGAKIASGVVGGSVGVAGVALALALLARRRKRRVGASVDPADVSVPPQVVEEPPKPELEALLPSTQGADQRIENACATDTIESDAGSSSVVGDFADPRPHSVTRIKARIHEAGFT